MTDKFHPPADAVGAVPPATSLSIGFDLRFDDEPSFEIPGRRGRVHIVTIVNCPLSFKRDAINAMLIGQRVPGRGTIRGVESHCVMFLGEGEKLGLLIEGP